jgi:hypothetical protein
MALTLNTKDLSTEHFASTSGNKDLQKFSGKKKSV